MSGFYEGMRDTAVTMLKTFGSPVTIRRLTKDYDSATRRSVDIAALEQSVSGLIVPPEQANRKLPDSFTSMFSRIAYLSPSPLSGDEFTADIKDVIDDGETVWIIKALSVMKFQGVVVMYTAGLDKA